MDDITVEVCGENGAWYKVCTKQFHFTKITQNTREEEKKSNRFRKNTFTIKKVSGKKAWKVRMKCNLE